MRIKQNLSAVLMLGLGLSSSAFAANVSLQGTIPGVVVLKPENSFNFVSSNSVEEKAVTFQRVILSPEAKRYLAQRVDAAVEQPARLHASLQSLPSAMSLGMNGVPVLDQGRHGTCVTFAVTGALDAALGEQARTSGDDHFSPLCSLELGSTLEKQSPVDKNGEHTYPSGWDGSWASIVLDQIKTHGFITKKYQHSSGCAGVRQYPLMVESDHGKAMAVGDFDSHSEKASGLASYKLIMNSNDAFTPRVDTSVVLEKVKTAIATSHRVTFGTLLDVDQGYNGALGKYKTNNDTWILTPAIAEDAKKGSIEAGHEMIIIGYDDNAEATGPKGEKHKGVLTLRNSWGKRAGDQGNYYMTYDHFKTLVLEAAEFVPVQSVK